MDTRAEYVDGLPSLCGQESLISEAIEAGRQRPVFPAGMDIERAGSTFAVALHMHQPLIPAAGDDLRSAAIISNLAWMMDHPDLADNHNARCSCGATGAWASSSPSSWVKAASPG
jgi:hypothetical protein